MSSDAFAARRTEVTGATWTPRATILAALAIPADQNLFTLDTRDLAARLAAIPAIRGASVTVALPDEVRVDVDEREALLVWQVGTRRYLVDEGGLLFAELDAAAPAAADELPVVDDRRLASAGYDTGMVIDPVNLDAALRLGSLRPADLGSAATRLDDQPRRRQGVRGPRRPGRLDRRVRVLHADPAHHRARAGAGAAPAQHARGPGGRGAPRDPRRRPQRDPRPDGRTPRPSPSAAP